MTVERIAHLTGHIGAVYAIAEGTTPQYIFTAAGDGWLVVWDLAKPDLGKLVAKAERSIYALAFLKEQNQIVAGDMDGGVRFIDLNDAEKTRNVKHHTKGCFGVQVFDNQLFTIGGDGILTRWSVAEKRSVESIHLSTKSLRAMDFSADKNEIAIGASDGFIYFLDAKTLAFKSSKSATATPSVSNAHAFGTSAHSVFSLKYLADDWLLTGGRDAQLKLWMKQNFVENVAAHLFTVNDMAFHPTDKTLFATASRDKTIKIWRFTEGGDWASIKLLKVIDTIKYGGHLRSVNRLFWSSFNNYLISASDDRTLMVWRIEL